MKAFVLLLLGSGLGFGEVVKSFYSTTAEKFVAAVESPEFEEEPEGDYYRAICPGYGGYELVYEAGDARSWLNIRFGDETSDLWSGTMEAGRGFFVAKANDVVEWRGAVVEGEFRPYAVIYRVTAQHPDNEEKSLSTLVVVALLEGKSKVIGSAHGEGEDIKAKAIADQWWRGQKR